MYNIEELTAETKKYLEKLKKIVEMEPEFFITKTKLVSQTRVDDVMCCIEASFPVAYRNYINDRGGRSMKSYSSYLSLYSAMKKKFFLAPSSYSVNQKEVVALITMIIKTIDKDLKLILENQTHMFDFS